MTDNPLSSKVGLDVNDWKTGVAQLNQSVRVIESGFKASAAALGDWSKDAGGLEARIKSLNGEIEIQDKKVWLLDAAYKKLVQEKGADSRAAQDLQIKLNKATEQLNSMKTEVGKNETALKQLKAGGTEPAKTGVKDLGKESDNTGKKMISLKGIASGLKSVLGGVGQAIKASVVGLASVAGAAAGAVAGLGALVVKAAQTGDDLDTLSKKTGLSTTEIQYLAYIGKQTGTDLDVVTGSMSKLVKSMDAAKKYGTPAAEAFRQIGVKTRDANGNLRDSRTVFNEAVTALGGIDDETKRDTISMALFGKSAQELNPLIETSAADLAQMRSQADKVGAIIPEDQVQQAAALNDKIDSLKSGFQGIVMQVAGMFVPAVSGAADQVSGFMTRLAGAVGLFKSNPQAAQLMITSLVSDMLAQVPKILGLGLTILQVLITAILTALPKLLPAVITLIKTLIGFIVKSLPMVIQAGMDIVTALILGIVPMLPELLKSGLNILMQLLQGMLAALPQIIPVITSVVLEMVGTLTTMLPQILTVGIQVLMALINGIVQALPALIPAVVSLLLALTMALVQNLPILVQAALDLIIALAQGLIIALPILIQQAPVIIQALVDGLVKMLPVIVTTASALVDALVQGIKSNLPGLKAADATIAQTILTPLQAMGNSLLAAGKDIVTPIWNGIKTGWAGMMVSINGLVARLTGFGKQIIDSLVGGITSGITSLQAVGAKILSTITYVFNNFPYLMGVLAGNIIGAFIKGILAIPKIIEAAKNLITTFVDNIRTEIPKLAAMAILIIANLVDNIRTELPKLAAMAVLLIANFLTSLTNEIPKIITKAQEMVTALMNGMKELPGKITTFVKDAITGLPKAVDTNIKKLTDVGDNIVKGIWQGIQNAKDWFSKQINSFFSGIVDGVKKSLGVKSPSTVFAGIGKNMALGLGLGFGDQMRDVERKIFETTRGLSMSGNLALAGAGGGGGRLDNSTHSTFNNYGTVIYPGGAGSQPLPKAKRF